MSETKIINVAFGKSRDTTTSARYRYDYGQVIEVVGINLPETFEARFSNSPHGESIRVIGTQNKVDVPDGLFLTGEPIYCYITVHDEDTDGRTMYSIKIPVKDSTERTDADPTPVEQDVITQAIASLNNAIDRTTENVEITNTNVELAQESASNAQSYAESANSYAENAQTSVNSASAYAENASNSAMNAEASAVRASGSETHVEQMATEVEQIAQHAETASNNAESSATVSAQKAADALNSANIASTKANEASGFANDAQGSANSAQSYASNSEQSATNAQTYMNSASMSANQAQLNAEKTQSDKEVVESAKSNVLSAVNEAQTYATTAQSASQAIQDMNVEAVTLGVNSDVTVEKSVDPVTGAVTLTYGIPKGVKGEKGDKGDQGIQGEHGERGEKGDKGSKGDKGDAFTYADFTPEQLASLKGERGEQGIQGVQGEKGDAFTYADFTPEQLVSLKGEKGDKGDQGIQGEQGIQGLKGDTGEKGDKGDAFTYADFTPEQLASLKGEKGDKGDAAITVDAVPTQGSTNAVQSGGVYSALADKADKENTPKAVTPTETDADFYLSDANGNVILELVDGHIKTKEFDSSDINTETDTTLSVQGKPADAKAVGDAISAVEDDIQAVEESIPDVSSFADVKTPQETTADLFICDSHGNVIAELKDGHIVTKNFNSADVITEDDITDLESAVSDLSVAVSRATGVLSTTEQNVDLDVVDASGNVILRLVNGHIQTKNFDSSHSDQNAVLTVNNTAPDANGNVNVRAELDPEDIAPAVEDYLDEHPVVASGGGVVSVADYGAVGDGITDDSQAIQNAVNSNYDVYFESDHTYYLASEVTITHDVYLHGGKNAIIKTVTPADDIVNNGFHAYGTLKYMTTLTSDYLMESLTDSDNVSNRLTLVDMSNVDVGDILVIKAADQYFCPTRSYYHLGATLLVTDKYDGHIYVHRNMPFDITLTNSVTVSVYSAPTVRISNLHFVSDTNAFGSEHPNGYTALVLMEFCKNSTVTDCVFDHFKMGLRACYCVNAEFSNLTFAKGRYDNTTGFGDGYALVIDASTHTSIRRVIALCAQNAIDFGGEVPCIDSYISQCDVGAECRPNGIGMHENAYNTVIEDCILSGCTLQGTVTLKRCQFVRNFRAEGQGGLQFYGLPNPKHASLHISDCIFPIDGQSFVYIQEQGYQDYVSSFDEVIDSVIIENCTGGALAYDANTNSVIKSHTINKMVINNWRDCREFFLHGDGTIKKLDIKDSTFIKQYAINKHSGGFYTELIQNGLIHSDIPYKKELHVNLKDVYGARYVLPEKVPINVSSDDANSEYMICGINCGSDDPADYAVGTVSSPLNGALSRNADATATAFLSGQNHNLVYALPNGYTTKKHIYPKGIIYVESDEQMLFTVSAVLRNTGNSNPCSFYPYIVLIDTATGKVVYSGRGTSQEATVQGVKVTHSRTCLNGYACFWYLENNVIVGGSETTIEQITVTLTPYSQSVPVYSEFSANRRTGDGIIESISGQNNIISTSETFNIDFVADYVQAF